jgi:lysophospholipase L1-like esterase
VASNGCNNFYRLLFPLHVAYSGAQLAFAVAFLRAHHDVRLVTIDIGANDLFLCQKLPDNCTGTDFAATLKQITTNLTTIYRTLREDAGYHHDLVALTYYSLSYSDLGRVAGTKALNKAIIKPTLAAGGVVANGFEAFRHPSLAAGGTPCQAGLVIPLPTGGCDVHPTAQGHRLLARAILEALEGGGSAD